MKSSGRREKKFWKPQAASYKLQATSLKLLNPQAASGKLQAPSSKRQATSLEQRAPRHLYPHKVLEASV